MESNNLDSPFRMRFRHTLGPTKTKMPSPGNLCQESLPRTSFKLLKGLNPQRVNCLCWNHIFSEHLCLAESLGNGSELFDISGHHSALLLADLQKHPKCCFLRYRRPVNIH